MRLQHSGPVVLLFTDGAGLLTGVDPDQKVFMLEHARAPTAIWRLQWTNSA
jgi:hypothetical protein